MNVKNNYNMKDKKHTVNERIDTLEKVFAKLFIALSQQSKEIKQINETLNIGQDDKEEE
tara:strand:+ start:36 stop:212 length:177 start_codon:yes stop_codon:yes gene_type:complete